jgi:hypothetical protein
MADLNIKKYIIKQKDLPPVNSQTTGYFVRYRIVSEDKNRLSHWSPIFPINPVPLTSVEGALSITSSIITTVWGDELNRPEYDIFVKFDSGSFSYHGTSPIHTYSFLNTGTTSVHVKIQVASSIKEVKESLVIFDSGVESLV